MLHTSKMATPNMTTPVDPPPWSSKRGLGLALAATVLSLVDVCLRGMLRGSHDPVAYC